MIGYKLIQYLLIVGLFKVTDNKNKSKQLNNFVSVQEKTKTLDTRHYA